MTKALHKNYLLHNLTTEYGSDSLSTSELVIIIFIINIEHWALHFERWALSIWMIKSKGHNFDQLIEILSLLVRDWSLSTIFQLKIHVCIVSEHQSSDLDELLRHACHLPPQFIQMLKQSPNPPNQEQNLTLIYLISSSFGTFWIWKHVSSEAHILVENKCNMHKIMFNSVRRRNNAAWYIFSCSAIYLNSNTKYCSSNDMNWKDL